MRIRKPFAGTLSSPCRHTTAKAYAALPEGSPQLRQSNYPLLIWWAQDANLGDSRICRHMPHRSPRRLLAAQLFYPNLQTERQSPAFRRLLRCHTHLLLDPRNQP